MKKLDDLKEWLTVCDHYRMARIQRVCEVNPIQGSYLYEKVGCFMCDGYNKDCDKYTTNFRHKPIMEFDLK